MSRSKNSMRNLITAMIGQGLGIIISFIARIVFIRILGSEYLGLNGLFTNILTVLSLAELGVGEAITFSLYKPLSENDNTKCKMLMQLYRKVYIIIGIVVLILGISITPILSLLINELPSISNISLIYILFVGNTSISYFFSYKRNLIIADQNRYISTIYRYVFYFILNVAQAIYLLFTKDYIGYLILQIISTLFENICISQKANKMYPYLKEKDKIKLDTETKKEIIKNTKAMLMHKIGGIVVSSTDNILLSRFVSLIAVGLYSNYYLIISALNTVFAQIYSSLIASVGNLFVTETKEKQFEIYKKVDFLGFWIYSFASICLLCLFNPFIEIWVGKEYLFGMEIVLILVINFYITGMRKSVLTFREASGLFYKDRWKAVIEAVINLVASILLALKFGTFGIFLGTFISSVTVCVWVEPYILFKYAFEKRLWSYFKQYFKYLAITLALGIITYCSCYFINLGSFLSFIIKMLICLTIPNLGLYLIYRTNNEFIYFKEIIVNILMKIKSNVLHKK